MALSRAKTHLGLVGGREQHRGVAAHELLGVEQAVLARELDGGGDDEVVAEVGDRLEAGVVAADGEHEGAALERVGGAGERRGDGRERHLLARGGGLGGARGGLDGAVREDLLRGADERRDVGGDERLGVEEAGGAHEQHGRVDDQVLGLLGLCWCVVCLVGVGGVVALVRAVCWKWI